MSINGSIIRAALPLFIATWIVVNAVHHAHSQAIEDLAEVVRTEDDDHDSETTDLKKFEDDILPILREHCFDCHGPYLSEGNVRIDALNPDLIKGGDTDWWIEIYAVVTKGEMPPPDDSMLSDEDRQNIVEWLSDELQAASEIRRRTGSRSAFRRLTQYEYNYALQDLLGLPFDFAKDLPPEPHSEEGFENSSDLLHLSVTQFETYYRLARQALDKATVIGERPDTLYWGISMADAARREWKKQDGELEKIKQEFANDPEKLEAELARIQEGFRSEHKAAYFKNVASGRTAPATWEYYGAKYAFTPVEKRPEFPDLSSTVAVLPAGRRQNLVIELGNQLPDEGIMRVSARVARVNTERAGFPSLQLLFGWQASNEGRALLRVSTEDIAVTASPENPQIVQWDIPLGEIYPRNTVRKTSAMGAMPSPSEYVRIVNSSASDNDVQLDYVIVEAPFVQQWPPKSHQQIFLDSDKPDDETAHATKIIREFMTRAWRRPPEDEELRRKLDLFTTMREQSECFEEAIIEVLATILSSPQFLFVSNSYPSKPPVDDENGAFKKATPIENCYPLASRLSLFLWCSVPDRTLLDLAATGQLSEPETFEAQIERMLQDPRSRRFSEQFVHQWLNLELLEFVNLERNAGQFDSMLKEAMRQEPIELFRDMLQQNASVMDFIHSDYTLVNERLAKHYGIKGVYGNEFQRVVLSDGFRRGGLLTQAAFLTMNSDWPDSHPLKRAIWLLERVLNDPPPPPPPAVPQIDLADPEIAKMTLKERIENHRNQAACKSCHAKIDPWGIAFENYDALGRWREKINGKPIDAASELYNHQVLDGMQGLKQYLMESRQDQFVHAMVHKLTTFALGRTLGFEDRAALESITADVRKHGNGLQSMIIAIVKSDLFRGDL